MGVDIVERMRPDPEPKKAAYQMPKVRLGQVVLWSYSRDAEKNPALVLKVGTDTLTLSLHIPYVKDHSQKSGVRHVDDPFLITHPAHDEGVWDFNEWDKEIRAHIASFGSDE